MKHILKTSFLCLALIPLMACGGGSSSSGSSTDSVSVSSLSSLPDVSSLVSNDGASGSLSLRALQGDVSGTAPALSSIDEDNADTYFWNGLIDDINTNGFDAETDMDGFWDGEGACRMAQGTGFAFENIMRGGTSLCYMKNAPAAASGVTITSGSISNPASMFDQQAESFLVKLNISGFPGEEEEEEGSDIGMIRVYGTNSSEGANGYAADIFFCASSVGSPTGYEQIRINSTNRTINQTAVESGNGTQVSTISAFLTEAANGSISYDTNGERSATFYYTREDEGTFKASLTIDGDSLITKAVNINNFSTDYQYITSQYAGDSIENIQFLTAGFAIQPYSTEGEAFEGFSGATEFQDTHYVAVESGALYEAATSFDFDADAFYTLAPTAPSGLVEAIANFDCGETPDIVVAMDMSDEGLTPVIAECELSIDNMNFCDGADVQEARTEVFDSFQEGPGD